MIASWKVEDGRGGVGGSDGPVAMVVTVKGFTRKSSILPYQVRTYVNVSDVTRKVESTRHTEISHTLTFLLSFETSDSYSDLKLIRSN